MDVVAWAQQQAKQLVEPLGNRWRHTQAVADRAAKVAPVLPEPEQELLVAAAYLHDIGYAPMATATGFHPLDGARFLEQEGAESRLVCLVAHHSEARIEAEERGLESALAVYPREDGPLLDALTYSDMTTGPTGQTVAFEDRISEILVRYSPEDPVHRAISRARPSLAAAVERTTARLENGQPM